MIPRSDDEYAALLKERQNTAGRFGFALGCCTAIVAITINLWRAPQPWTWGSIALAVLMAALNVPLGIGLGLLSERVTRPPRNQPKR
jgi:hypothetical protein